MARRRTSPTTSSTSSGMSSGIKLAIAAAIFALGLGLGVSLSTLNPTPQTIDAISLDVNAPSRDFCNNYGASAMVMTSHVYVTLNPFNVFVSQAKAVPGCVVLPNNWNFLLQKKAINDQNIRDCRERMNTFGYTGDLDKSPQVECVYESKDAKKQLSDNNQVVTP